MFCSRKGNGIPITCTATSQKWTGQPMHLAGSKNPLTLGMGSVKTMHVCLPSVFKVLSLVFITFIAMIVRNEMFQKMEELRKKNRKAYTVPGILSELENIECTRNSVGKYRRKYALTSKQKQILKQFGMDEKYIDAGISKFSY